MNDLLMQFLFFYQTKRMLHRAAKTHRLLSKAMNADGMSRPRSSSTRKVANGTSLKILDAAIDIAIIGATKLVCMKLPKRRTTDGIAYHARLAEDAKTMSSWRTTQVPGERGRCRAPVERVRL